MAEPTSRILNPFLGLVSVYQRDGKGFKDVVSAITSRMNDLGMNLTPEYVDDKVLPWVLSFLFMTTAVQLLDEHIKSITSPSPAKPPAE